MVSFSINLIFLLFSECLSWRKSFLFVQNFFLVGHRVSENLYIYSIALAFDYWLLRCFPSKFRPTVDWKLTKIDPFKIGKDLIQCDKFWEGPSFHSPTQFTQNWFKVTVSYQFVLKQKIFSYFSLMLKYLEEG